MKPRFSILALLGFTAYSAVAIAGLVDPDSIWNSMCFYLWLLLLVGLAVLASTSSPPQSNFAACCLAVTLIYTIAAVVAHCEDGGYWMALIGTGEESEHTWMPHLFAIDLFQLAHPTFDFEDEQFFPWNARMYRWAVCNTSLAFGLLGGYVALWRYRVLERRQKKPTD